MVLRRRGDSLGKKKFTHSKTFKNAYFFIRSKTPENADENDSIYDLFWRRFHLSLLERNVFETL